MKNSHDKEFIKTKTALSVICFISTPVSLQVLNRYEDFKQEARAKREKLEDSRRFQYFKRDADELESWIQEKLQAASDESYKDPTNLQVNYSSYELFKGLF